MNRPAKLAGVLALSGALLAAGCDGGGEGDAAAETALVPYAPEPRPSRQAPPLAGDFPELSSKECVDVVRFYLEALGDLEYDKAALVWNDPMIDGARLEALFAGYREPLFEWTEPFVESAGRSLVCTAGGTLFDAKDPVRPIVQGRLELRRVDDLPGATPAELRWTLRSSSFLQPLRSEGT